MSDFQRVTWRVYVSVNDEYLIDLEFDGTQVIVLGDREFEIDGVKFKLGVGTQIEEIEAVIEETKH